MYEKVDSSIQLTPLSNVFNGSDAILFVTDHDIFTTLDFSKIKDEMKTPLVIDGRNFFNGEKLNSLGFFYKAIGKP